MNNQLQKVLDRELTRKEFLGLGVLAVASLFGIVGLIRELNSQAATLATATEPEDGTITPPATKVTDATASGGSTVRFGTASTPPPSTGSWQEAINLSVAQQTTVAIRTWYESNTGHTALGWVEGTPGPGQRKLVAGSLTSTHHGQVIEGVVGGVIRVSHNNVTIRGCRVVGGGVYGAYLNPTFSAPVTGLRIEYCTIYYGQVAPDLNAKVPMFISPVYTANTDPDVVISHCDTYDWSGGIRTDNKVRTEYCYVHDWQHPPGVHSSSIWPQHNGGHVYRNYCTEGRSGVISVYFDKEPTHNMRIEENVMSGESPGASPSYLMNFKPGTYSSTATDIKVLNNYWHTGYQYGILAGAQGVPWGSNGNERTGNRWLMTGVLEGNT
jgi:hypothetical protein